MSEDPPRKRSRFDQMEPEPRKNSRFDRRSRSPSARHSESRRSRSPAASRSPSGQDQSGPQDAAARAASAAARINADLQARKGIQHVDVPPIRSTSSPSSAATPKISSGQSISKVDGEIYIADGDYIKDIEVNDLRNRYTLTKGSTQKEIKDETGADVTTRGSYYPDKSLATAANPPLYLHVTSTSKAGLEKAVEKIEELMKQELPNLVDERRFRRRDQDTVERDEFGRRKWPEERIILDMENVPGFNLRAQVVGQGGSYVKHIQQETGCRVQIKGKGSGFMEHSTGQESDEPMYLHVAGPQPEQVKKAKDLCESLLESVRANYERFKANPPPQRIESYTDGYGADAQRGSYGGYGRSNSYNSGSYNAPGQNGSYGGGSYNSSYNPNNPSIPPGTYSAPTQASPPPNTASPASQMPDQATLDYYTQYYASLPGGDPYAQYGGYASYVQQYQAYYQSQAQQAAPPPPSSGYDQPPPPPPPGS